jgi:hypothetical protein
MGSEQDNERAEIDREVEEQTASALPDRTAMSVIDPSLVKLPIAKLVLPPDVAPPVEDVAGDAPPADDASG